MEFADVVLRLKAKIDKQPTRDTSCSFMDEGKRSVLL